MIYKHHERQSLCYFIIENDVLGRGMPVYHVERCILEFDGLFGDGAHILYAIGVFRGARRARRKKRSGCESSRSQFSEFPSI